MMTKEEFMAAFQKWQAQQPPTMTQEEFTTKFNEFAKTLGFDTTVSPSGITAVPASKTKREERGTVGVGAGKVNLFGTAKVIKPNGEVIPVAPKDGQYFSYEEMLALTESECIQEVTPPGITGGVMILDEEGKLNNKPINVMASRIWKEGCDPASLRADDDVVGTVLLCHKSQIKYD